jgi:hypothetical protein
VEGGPEVHKRYFFKGGWARSAQAQFTRGPRNDVHDLFFFLGWVGPQRTSTIFGCMRHYVALTAARDYASAKRGRRCVGACGAINFFD